jgi:hypothetical protein
MENPMTDALAQTDFGEAGVNFPMFAPDGERLLILSEASNIAMIGAPPWPRSGGLRNYGARQVESNIWMVRSAAERGTP